MSERDSTKWIFCFTFFTGAIALTSQLALLREFLLIFRGNELVIGVFLAVWMLLTGSGAALSKLFKRDHRNRSLLIVLQLMLSLMPLLSYFILRFTGRYLIPEGSQPGLNEAVICSLLVLSPVCLLSGYAFVEYCRMIKDAENKIISQIYIMDVAGSIAGGVLLNVFLILYMDAKIVLLIIIALNTICLFYYTCIIEKYSLFPAFLIYIIIVLGFALYFKGKMTAVSGNMIEEANTPYGRVSVTKTNEQYNFFDNGTLLFSTNYVNECEENVHYAMAQHPSPQQILLISGGASGMLNEIAKYKPVKVDYIEPDPAIITLARKYTRNIPDMKSLNLITGDARTFIRNTKVRYDVILITLPEPSTALLSRFYSLEFFNEIKKIMNTGAIAATSLPATEEYMSKEAVPLNSILFNTMKKVFKNVLIVPGGKNYFLASDSSLTLHIVQNLKEKKIENLVVNEYYMDETLLKQRNDYVMKSLGEKSILNTDFRPVVYYYQTRYFLSYFGKQPAIYFLIILLIVLIIIIKPNSIHLGMMTGGFAATSLELALIFGMEVIYGYVFMVVGSVITLFMLGLAAGAYSYNKIKVKTRKHFIIIQFCIALFSIILLFVLNVQKDSRLHTLIVAVIFALLTFTLSFLTGLLFASASHLNIRNIASGASSVYGADLAGSAIGALLVSSVLLPLFGLNMVCLITAGLCLFSGSIAIINKKIRGSY